MEKFIRVLLIAALIAAGFLAWRFFFPNPERVIKSRLNSLAKTVSFDGSDGGISRALKADKVGDFFTLEVELTIDVPGYRSTQTINSRTEIRQGLLAAQQRFPNARVEFLDINVTLDPGGESAVANLTLDLHLGGERAVLQELNMTLKKIEGKWLITKVETVKTLSSVPAPSRILARAQ
jgi:hypothetical protein